MCVYVCLLSRYHFNDLDSNSDRVEPSRSGNNSTYQELSISKIKLQPSMAMPIVAPQWSFLFADSRAWIVARMDQNDGGIIDRSEFKAPNDRDRDGANKPHRRAGTDGAVNISRAELNAMQAQLTERARNNPEGRSKGLANLFAETDINADGIVFVEELRVVAFQKMDESSAGHVSMGE